MSRQKSGSNRFAGLIIVVNVLLITSLTRNAWGLYRARQRLDRVKADVSTLEAKKQAVELQVEAQQDPAALDQSIRNQLNLIQPGETVVIIPENLLQTPAASSPATRATTSPLFQWLRLLRL